MKLSIKEKEMLTRVLQDFRKLSHRDLSAQEANRTDVLSAKVVKWFESRLPEGFKCYCQINLHQDCDGEAEIGIYYPTWHSERGHTEPEMFSLIVDAAGRMGQWKGSRTTCTIYPDCDNYEGSTYEDAFNFIDNCEVWE